MSENPKVTSKFDRNHGMPRDPAHVGHPGEAVKPTSGAGSHEPFGHERHAPHEREEVHPGITRHHYAPHHPAMGGLHDGDKAEHPYHDNDQDEHEGHGYGGKGE